MSIHGRTVDGFSGERRVSPRWVAVSLGAAALFAVFLVTHAGFAGSGATGSRVVLGFGGAILALGAFVVARRSTRERCGIEVAFLGLGTAGVVRTLMGLESVAPGAAAARQILTADVVTAVAYAGTLLLAAAGRRRLLWAGAAATACMPAVAAILAVAASPVLTAAAAVAAAAAAWMTLASRRGSDGIDLAARASAVGAAAGLGATLMPASDAVATLVLRAALTAPLAGLLGVVIIRGARNVHRGLIPRVRLGIVGATIVWIALAVVFGAASAGGPGAPLVSPLLAAVIAVGFGFTMIGLLVAKTTTARLARELDDFTAATHALARGRFDGHLPFDSSRELARLALAFNAMSERIHLQREELLILARVMDGTSDPVAVIGRDGRIAYVNRAFTTATGWSPMDLIGHELASLLSPRGEEARCDGLREALEGGESWARETMVAARGGRVFASFTTVVPVHSEDRHIYHVAVSRDLRTLKKLESERTAFAESLLEIHEAGQELVSTLDPDEIHENVVASIAERFGAAARVWLVAEGEQCADCAMKPLCVDDRCLQWVATGAGAKPASTCIPFGTTLPGLAAKNGRREIAGLDVSPALLAHERNDRGAPGGIRAAFPIVVEEELLGVLEVHEGPQASSRFVDSMQLMVPTLGAALSNARLHRKVVHQARALEELTGALESTATRQRTHAEELRAVNEKLLEADRLKSRFLSTTSHELRTPLSGCLGFLSLILDGMAADRDEEIEFVREAHACARTLLETINIVLDIAKLEAGRVPMTPQRVDAQALVDDAVGSIDAGDLEVTVDVPANTRIHADYKHSRKALVQLIHNAIKFTDEGSVQVTARPCSDRGIVEIEVTDTGVGLPDADVTALFDAFVQGESGDDRRFGGSGLGLTLCRELARMMGGTVRLGAGRGGGATAVLSLPIHRVEAFQPASRDTTPPATVGGPVVLMVDGDSEYTAMARRMIDEVRPARVEVVATAPEALDVARRLLPDWVLTEYALPYGGQPTLVTGADLVGALAQEPSGSDIRVAIVTGHPTGDPQIAARLEGLGVAVVSKPLARADLRALLEPAAETARATQPFRVLLVDDDPGVADAVRHGLDEDLFEIQSVQDGREALYHLSRPAEAYDVVLLDLLMPGMSGYEVLQALRNDLASRLPVVILSNDFETVEQRSLLEECGVDVIISKEKIATAPHKLARAVVEAARITTS